MLGGIKFPLVRRKYSAIGIGEWGNYVDINWKQQ